MKLKKERIEWIDIARALTMFCVIVGHITPIGDIHTFMYSFHVPAFFFLSGMVTSCRGSFLQHTAKKIRTIMLPYYFFGIAAIAVYLLLGHLIPQSSMLSLKDCFYGLAYGSAKTDCMKFNLHLWFLPVLFVMNIIIYPIRRIAKRLGKQGTVMCIAAVISLVISALIFTYKPLNYFPLGADTAVRLFPFFIAGNAVSCSERIMMPRKKSAISTAVYPVVSVVLFALTAVLAKLNEMKTAEGFHVNYFRDYYGNSLLFWIAAISGIAAIIAVSKLIPPVKPLTYVGQKTLAILVMQKFPIMLFNTVIPFTAVLLDSSNVIAITVLSAVTVICCLAVNLFAERYLPFVYGKRYSIKTK